MGWNKKTWKYRLSCTGQLMKKKRDSVKPNNCLFIAIAGWLSFPVDTGRKLNVHKTFRRRPGRLLDVLCTFNLRPVSTGFLTMVSGTKSAFWWKSKFPTWRKYSTARKYLRELVNLSEHYVWHNETISF